MPNRIGTEEPREEAHITSDAFQQPLIILVSYHHKNTERVAQAIAETLGARILAPSDISDDDIQPTRLVGFGSGIYSAKHHPDLLALADRLQPIPGARAFLFSTFGAPKIAATPSFIESNHSALRERLKAKGFEIVGEFACPGHNTNSFLRFFGGLNKEHPNKEDLQRATVFARSLRGRGESNEETAIP